MEIAMVRLGEADKGVANRIQENLATVFANAEITLIAEALPVPEEAYSRARQQYRSDVILSTLRRLAETRDSFDSVLGIVDVDLFVPRSNFVFGEADSPGRVAVVSLWRLRPEFYGRRSDVDVLVERGTKEAVHELGHTQGLRHCANPFCVMYFSNSIFETDRKQSLFCNKCYLKTTLAKERGMDLERRV